MSPSLAGATDCLNVWKHLTAVVDKTAGTIKTYVDGVQDQTGSFTAGAPGKDVGESPFIFNSSLQASFDELRADTAARSADWVKATYDNQKQAPPSGHSVRLRVPPFWPVHSPMKPSPSRATPTTWWPQVIPADMQPLACLMSFG